MKVEWELEQYSNKSLHKRTRKCIHTLCKVNNEWPIAFEKLATLSLSSDLAFWPVNRYFSSLSLSHSLCMNEAVCELLWTHFSLMEHTQRSKGAVPVVHNQTSSCWRGGMPLAMPRIFPPQPQG
jgi:hypothetical protein